MSPSVKVANCVLMIEYEKEKKRLDGSVRAYF